MTIYEALQQNKMAFGLMETPEYTNEEMQAKAKELQGAKQDPPIFEAYFPQPHGWTGAHLLTWADNSIIRLRADYTEQVEDEYELCEITDNGSVLVFCRNSQSCPSTIDRVTTDPNFAGYLYEDDIITADDVRYFNKEGHEVYFASLEDLQSGEITIRRPYPNGSVVFKK